PVEALDELAHDAEDAPRVGVGEPGLEARVAEELLVLRDVRELEVPERVVDAEGLRRPLRPRVPDALALADALERPRTGGHEHRRLRRLAGRGVGLRGGAPAGACRPAHR